MKIQKIMLVTKDLWATVIKLLTLLSLFSVGEVNSLHAEHVCTSWWHHVILMLGNQG